MSNTQLPQRLFSGFAFGSLVYGGGISFAHLLYNRLGSPRDALILLLFCAGIYGLAGAAAFGLGQAAALLRRRLRGDRAAPPAAEDSILAGLLVFNLPFWELFFLHGVTYDQYPFGALHSVWGMLLFLAVCAALIAAAVLAVSWACVRLLRPVLQAQGGGRLGISTASALVLLTVVGALGLGRAEPGGPIPRREGAAAFPPAAPIQATGVKVILIGLDGADWRVVRPLMARGELPRFQEIERRGTAGPLTTFRNSNSAVIWASIYSGARPERHQVWDFYRIHLLGMAGDGVFPVHRTFFKEIADRLAPLGLTEQITMTRGDLLTPPVWEIADHLGLTTGLVDGYYYSFPAVKPETAGGYRLAYGLDAFYEQLASGAGAARLKDLDLFLQPDSLFREIKPLLALRDFEWQAATLLHLLDTHAWPRLVSLYSHQPDTVQHLTWKWYQPELFLGARPEDIQAKGDEIGKTYRAFDRFLGEILSRMDQDTVLLVVSDHGHSPTLLHQNYYSQHRHGPPGIFLACGGPVRKGARVEGATVLDVFPTVLDLLGLPVPADAAGRVLTGILDPAFLAAHPPGAIPTYQGRWENPAARGAQSGLEREELQKLRALGYL